jgi:hypothetical protein
MIFPVFRGISSEFLENSEEQEFLHEFPEISALFIST